MVEMKVEDVVVRVAADDASEVADEFGAIVLLKERAGERSMPIFVGLTEGATLAARVAGDSFPRPTAADLMVDLVRVAGGRIERVVISSIRDNTFYAAISINGEEVDARPSDAIGLAVRIGAPIVLDEGLLTEHGLAGLELVEWLEREAARVGYELPPGEWRSLSAELMHALGARRLDKLPGQVRTER